MNNSYQNTIGNRWRGYFLSAYGIAVKHGFVGSEEDWLLSLTAYGIALRLGFKGTQEEWIASLKGEKGDPFTFYDFTEEQLEELKTAIAGAVLTDAETSKKAAEEAKEAAESAVDVVNAITISAEKAAKDANTAKEAAESAEDEAKSYYLQAEYQAENADGFAKAAEKSMQDALDYASNALRDAQSADSSALSAAESARNAAQNAVDVKKNCANALRGQLFGASVSTDDVSPIEHELDVKITDADGVPMKGVVVKRYGKNLFENDTSKLAFLKKEETLGVDDYIGYKFTLPPGEYTAKARYKPNVNGTRQDYIYGAIVHADGTRTGGKNIVVNTPVSKLELSIIEGDTIYWYNAGLPALDHTQHYTTATEIFSSYDIQIELGNTATEYEPYREPIEAVSDPEGNVNLTSIAPAMTLTTDNAGAVIKCGYNKDTNKVIENLENLINAITISLGGNI